MNKRNLLLALKTAKEKLEYIEAELNNGIDKTPTEREKTKMDAESAIEFVKAKTRKAGRLPNDDFMLLKDLKGQFKGLWGKNVVANMFQGIAREDPEFRVEKFGQNVYLVKL